MKKTYIAPIIMADEADIEGILAMSIFLSDESGSEEFAKEQIVDDDDWDVDW